MLYTGGFSVFRPFPLSVLSFLPRFFVPQMSNIVSVSKHEGQTLEVVVKTARHQYNRSYSSCSYLQCFYAQYITFSLLVQHDAPARRVSSQGTLRVTPRPHVYSKGFIHIDSSCVRTGLKAIHKEHVVRRKCSCHQISPLATAVFHELMG
jgi:hypothetical protein